MGAYLATRRRTTGPTRLVVALLASAIGFQLVAAGAAVASFPESDSTATIVDPLPGPGRSLAAPVGGVTPPVRIDIPRIGVSAPVDHIDLNHDGTLAVPEDFGRTGWYRGLEAPGQVGSAVIVGHLDSKTGPAVFYRVPKLRGGDQITVTLADGSTVRFVVERTEAYDKDDFPTTSVYGSTDRPTLRLITCGGRFDKRTGHYSHNVVVYATAQEAL